MDSWKYEKFWSQRATNYDKLFWTKDEGYLNSIIDLGCFENNDVVLDVGIGTGAVSKKLKPLVRHVIGIDISDSMLKSLAWDGISIVKWDIRDSLFCDNLFDKIVARMVFHHIINDLDVCIKCCHRMLKKGGKMIVAEGLPPSDDPYVVKWYSDMFELKEERLTFTRESLENMIEMGGFENIITHEYTMKNFSIRNWLLNSGLEQTKQDLIFDLHLNSDDMIQSVYNMKFIDGDIFVDTKNLIIIAEK